MAISGEGGQVKVGTAPNAVGEVDQWKLDIDAAMLETTSFDSDGWKEYIAGLKDWQGSFDAWWEVATDTNGQKVIQDNLLAGASMQIELDVDGTHSYSGKVLIKKYSIDTQVKNVVKITYNFQGTGPCTFN